MNSKVNVHMAKCDSWWQFAVCMISSPFKYMQSIFSSGIGKGFKKELLRRVFYVHIDELEIKFERVRNFNMKVVNRGKIPKSIANWALRVMNDTLHEKIEKFWGKSLKSVGNSVIKKKLKPYFGNCTESRE